MIQKFSREYLERIACIREALGIAQSASIHGTTIWPQSSSPRHIRKQSQRCQPAYSGKDTPDLELCVDEQTIRLLRKLHEKYLQSNGDGPKQLLDIGLITFYYTMDIAMKLGFGHESEYIEREKDHYGYLEHTRRLSPYILTSADIPWLRNLIFSPITLQLASPKSTDKTGFGALMG
jgi:hypothetical protein